MKSAESEGKQLTLAVIEKVDPVGSCEEEGDEVAFPQ